MATTFLLGPIETGASFMITSIQGKKPYVLNGAPFNNGIIYYWEEDLGKVVSATGAGLGLFSASGSLNSLTITDSNNGGGIGFSSDGVTLVNTILPPEIEMSQSMYANWWPPDIFLSGAVYTIKNTAGSTAKIFTSRSGTGSTISADNIIIVPVRWYFNCTSSGRYDTVTKPADSLINWFCDTDPGLTGCSEISLARSAWTNLPDCTDGKRYEYCPPDKTCGDSNCKGPCPEIYYDCDFSNTNFKCVFDPRKFIDDTEWWTTPYFIGLVIGIAVIIVVITLMIFAVVRGGSKVKQSEYQ